MSNQFDRMGQLSDPAEQRAAQQAEKRARLVVREDQHALIDNPAFIRWIGKYVIPPLLEHVATTNGGDIQKFIGRRELAMKMVNELDEVQPGFLEKLLGARRSLLEDLKKVPQED